MPASLTSHKTTEPIQNGIAHQRSMDLFARAWVYPLFDLPGAHAALIVIVLLLCSIRAFVSLSGSQLYSHDAFMVLDGAWRMMNGQRPHIDFYSHVGVLTYAPTVVGLMIAKGNVNGFGYAQALVGLFLTAWTYLLARKRLADVPLFLMSVAIALITTAPYALGFAPLQVSPATVYNRFGYALLGIILTECILPARTFSKHQEFWGGFSSGAILMIALFLKITYLVAAICLIATLFIVRRQTRARWLGILAGTSLLAISLCSYFGFNILPMLSDLRMVAGSKHIFLRSYMLDSIFQNAFAVIIFSLLFALFLLVKDQQTLAWKAALVGTIISLAGVLLILGNCEPSGFPLGVFVALLFLEMMNREDLVSRVRSGFAEVCVLMLVFLFVTGSVFAGSLGVVYGLAQRVQTLRSAPRLHAARLTGFNPNKEDSWYADFVNDGLVLLEKHRRPGDTIMSLDFTNPFSYSLAMKPAKGGTTVLQYKTTFNDRFRPSAQELIGSAELVMMPQSRRFSDDSLDGNIQRLYGPYLKSHFRMIDQNAVWRLYRKN